MDAISLIASWERKVRLSCKKWNRKSGFTACLSRHQTCKMRKIEMKCQSKEKRFWPKIKSIHYRLIQNNFNFTQSFMTVVIKSNIHKRCLSYDSDICILVISPLRIFPLGRIADRSHTTLSIVLGNDLWGSINFYLQDIPDFC